MSVDQSYIKGADQFPKTSKRNPHRSADGRQHRGEPWATSGQAPPWHKISVERALDELESRAEGLDERTAEERLERFGENRVGRRR